MTYVTDPYDALYTNLKNRFTVIYEGAECTVGDYMLMKAGKRKASNLPAAPQRDAYEHKALTSIVDFVSERLTVKNPPAKDKTIKRFPFKTSISALLSSAAACALVLSCGIFALSGARKSVPTVTADSESYSSFELHEEPLPTEDEANDN